MRLPTPTLLAAAAALACAACEEETLDLVPADRVDIELFYTEPVDAEAGLLGVYSSVLRQWQPTLFINLGLSGHELYDANRGLANRPVGYRPALRVDNDGGTASLWRDGYAALTQANLAIARIPGISPGLYRGSDRQRESVAEAKFLRAYVYYHLVQLYGDVPLILDFPTTSNPVPNRVTRTPAAEVWAQIRADLADAIADLPLDHDDIRAFTFDEADGPLSNTKGRATKNAARLLMARVHLRFGEWAEAARLADDVIASGAQSLVGDWTRIFDNRNEPSQLTEEAIWEVPAFRLEFDGTGGYFFNVETPSRLSGTPDNALAAFDEPGADLRAGWSLIPSSAPERLTAAKYYHRGGGWGNPQRFNFVIFRLAEAYLIRAEARNELAYPDPDALADVNVLRARTAGVVNDSVYVGVAPVTFDDLDSQADMREFIRAERFRELMYEGVHFLDLLRYDSYDGGERALEATFLDDPGVEGADPGKLLLPLPSRDLRVNPNLTQNPPYRRG